MTGGVPTEDGIIFMLAIFTYVAVRYLRDKKSFEVMVLMLVLRVYFLKLSSAPKFFLTLTSTIRLSCADNAGMPRCQVKKRKHFSFTGTVKPGQT